jgi:hypothetical protein
MLDGVALGYDMTVLSDATYPPDSPPAHLEFLARWGAVARTEDVVARLSSAAEVATAIR